MTGLLLSFHTSRPFVDRLTLLIDTLYLILLKNQIFIFSQEIYASNLTHKKDYITYAELNFLIGRWLLRWFVPSGSLNSISEPPMYIPPWNIISFVEESRVGKVLAGPDGAHWDCLLCTECRPHLYLGQYTRDLLFYFNFLRYTWGVIIDIFSVKIEQWIITYSMMYFN